jgi:hypothetical protein
MEGHGRSHASGCSDAQHAQQNWAAETINASLQDLDVLNWQA